MRELMNLVNDIAPLVKIGWLVWLVWALAEIAWYRRAHVISWPRADVPRPLPRKIAPPIARAVAAQPAETAPIGSGAPLAESTVAPLRTDTAPAPATRQSRRRRRGSHRAATAGA